MIQTIMKNTMCKSVFDTIKLPDRDPQGDIIIAKTKEQTNGKESKSTS